MRQTAECFNGTANMKVENHEHSVAIHYMYYNFCRIHQTLRLPPATEAEITDQVWSLEEIVGLMA
jgi:hypothetical protein